MHAKSHRILITSCTLVAATLGTPNESHAFFHHLFGGCCGLFSRSTYRPAYQWPTAAYAAPSCSPCQTQTVRYVPQTCYRTVVQNVPVTSYRPVTVCDPCTGCPVTCMRPTTSYVQQRRYVPYTTYRPVVTTTAARPCCPTATVNYAAPSSACCTPSNTPSYAPSYAPSYTPAPATQGEVTPQPSLQQTPGQYESQKPIESNGNQGSGLQPEPKGASSINNRLRLMPPQVSDPRDRVTSHRAVPQRHVAAKVPAPRAVLTAVYVPASAEPAVVRTTSQEEEDAGGWRAASRN